MTDTATQTISYRPYCNRDTPHLAEVWRTRSGDRAFAQPASPQLFDQFLLNKPYFDRKGLILAFEGPRPVGFVHAGFGPNETETGLCPDLGATLMLLIVPHPAEDIIAADLLARSEDYLRGKQARVLYGGGMRPLNPFYLGLYGGSELPGILDSDPRMQAPFLAAGYRAIAHSLLFRLDLGPFHAPFDRHQLQIRRSMRIERQIDPPPRSWWEACTLGQFDRLRFDLLPSSGGNSLASATFWNLEPLCTAWGAHAVGLYDVSVAADHRREGLATYLIAEACKELQTDGIALIETQTMQDNTIAAGLYQKLGFEPIDRGTVFRK